MTSLATERINLRTSPHAKAIIEQASELMGVSVSNFVIEQAYYKAVAVVEQTQRLRLSPSEWEKAVAYLDNPPTANERMQALFERGYRAIHQ